MDQADKTPPKKKPYSTPVLREYGDLRRVSEANTQGAGLLDGTTKGAKALKTG